MRRISGWMLLAAVGVGVPGAFGQHSGDVFVGYVLSEHKLAVGGYSPEDNYPYLLPTSAILQGWSDSNPGFDHLINPAGDFRPLAPGSSVVLEAVALDPAFRVIGQPPTFTIVDAPGEQVALGGSQLHVHLTWHINSQSMQFDPEQCVWHATLRLVDVGSTGYAPSEPFTFAFTTVRHEAGADGDFDGDGLVNAEDAAGLAECLAGPGLRPAPDDPEITACEVECLNAFDFDGDLDVDLGDAAELMRRVS